MDLGWIWFGFGYEYIQTISDLNLSLTQTQHDNICQNPNRNIHINAYLNPIYQSQTLKLTRYDNYFIYTKNIIYIKRYVKYTKHHIKKTKF